MDLKSNDPCSCAFCDLVYPACVLFTPDNCVQFYCPECYESLEDKDVDSKVPFVCVVEKNVVTKVPDRHIIKVRF